MRWVFCSFVTFILTEACRRARSRFRERALSPPPIVVTEAVGAAPELNTSLPQSYDNAMPVMPSIRKPSISVASARDRTMPLPNEQRSGRNAGYLHPFSAVERRFPNSQSGVMKSVYQRSCPPSPIYHNLPSAGIASRAPALHIDTRCYDVDYNYIEIAMEVAEETARICDSPLPIPTDVPLVHSGLSRRTADDLKTWLMVRFNYNGHTHSLLDERSTPEFLARDIIRTSPLFHASRVLLRVLRAERSPDFGITSQRSGVIPISLGSPCKTPVMCVPEEASLLTSPANMVARSPFREVPPRRTRMKKDLTIKLTPSPVNTYFPHSPARPSTSPLPPPTSARRVNKAGSLDSSTGAPEPRSGKKAG